jgi:hypothetical protein
MSWFGDAADPRKSNEFAAFYHELGHLLQAAAKDKIQPCD